MSDSRDTRNAGAGRRIDAGNDGAICESLTLATLASPRLKKLHAAWFQQCGTRRCPARSDIKPETIAFILGSVTLVDVLRDPLRFRLRLIGSHVEAVGRRGDQGKMVDEIEPQYYAALLREAYADVVKTATFRADRITFRPAARPTLHPLSYERLILPLSSDGTVIDMLLVGSDWPSAITAELQKFHAGG